MNGVDGSRDSETARFLRNVERLAIIIDNTPDESGVLTLARRHRLAVYDAAYLELTARSALPLATLDAMLATAARSEGVHLLGDDAELRDALIARNSVTLRLKRQPASCAHPKT
jgi:hypothetical protein